MGAPQVSELAGPICETGCEGIGEMLWMLVWLALALFVAMAVIWWLAFVLPAVIVAPRLRAGGSRVEARVGWAVLSSIAAAVLAPVGLELGWPGAALVPVAWWALLAVVVHRQRAGGTP